MIRRFVKINMCQESYRPDGLKEIRKDAAKRQIIHLYFESGLTGRITFLEEHIFRYDVDPKREFAAYAKPADEKHAARIQQRPDESEAYTKPMARIAEQKDRIEILCGDTSVTFDKATARMEAWVKGRIVMEEAQSLMIKENLAVQTLLRQEDEDFFGGGTQNGRFLHTGKKIRIVNESGWMDGGVASPCPFYLSTAGYGALRNTFAEGSYDFGAAMGQEQTDTGTGGDLGNRRLIVTEHKENRFSAYYFLSGAKDKRRLVQELLQGYYHVTGSPVLLPAYGFYEGHLNCYNRDAWSKESGGKAWVVKGSEPYTAQGRTWYESGMAAGYRLTDGLHSESLNGEKPQVAAGNYPETVDTPYEYSARAVLEEYIRYDMPLGYFLPNDGYGGGYGQNGYYVQGGVDEDGQSSKERIAAVDANVENFARFTEFANGKGVASGLWTESSLSPDSDKETYWHLLRDFRKEVTAGGATTLKTDVAWVGPGYSFQLDGVKTAYDIVTTAKNFRPNIISLDGWAGSQRFNSVWTGDQTGGNWEYIRFHIPTYIGSSLSGNPNIGSDMDGIFGGKALIAVRDYQWKAFTPQMLNMDGWGSYMKAPYTFGDPYTGINRMYMKLKSQLMPYIYTCAVSAANMDTGNGDTGLPMVRAMFLEYPRDAYAGTREMQYQFMLGGSLLVAPVYRNVAADEMGGDVRNRIYLPDEKEVWTDYLTGEKYQGGQVLNNFGVPLWKLPVFVKGGAILPMYEENNTPDAIDRTSRIVEFWPLGTSEYTVYEDDGKYIRNQTEEDTAYGVIDHISYGNRVSVRYTSVVEGDCARLTAEKAEGDYEGYDPKRSTTFVVHLSEKPEEIIAKNGEALLHVKEVVLGNEGDAIAEDRDQMADVSVSENGTSLCAAGALPVIRILREAGQTAWEAFRKIVPEEGEAVFFYDEAPSIHTYAPAEEREIAKLVKGVKTAPKLYIKMCAADAAKEAQTVEIRGFVNEFIRPADKENQSLPVPALRVPEKQKTPTSIWLDWTEIGEADSYEMLVDGNLNAMGDTCSYLHDELEYHSEHTYRVRARNQEGYSPWSEELTASSLLDPWRDEIGALGRVIWTGGDEAGALKYATDHSFRGLFFAADDVVKDRIPFIYDFGAVYDLDRFEYYPRDSYGSGTVEQLNVYSSLDNLHWKLEWNGGEHEAWTYDENLELEENVKTVTLDGVSARFLKLEIVKSKKNFFASHELPVFKKEGSGPFAVGSTNKNEKVAEGDYINMKNYLGTSVRDGANFVDQIQKRCGDVNMNGVYDVYDYAFTMFALDGGTKQTGAVAGSILLIPETETVKAGETFTLAVTAGNVKNLNAFGKVLDYDPAHMEFVSAVPGEGIGQMENLTVNKRYGDGTAYVNLAFANRGDQRLYDGSGDLATLTMKALTDITVRDEIECEGVWLIGPEYDMA